MVDTYLSMPIEVFYAYAHKDEALRKELENHLALLKHQGFITSWHDRQIVAGIDWAYAINEHLNAAQIILLLVSADFLVSDYCMGIEMQRALERHGVGEAHVIPIILRPCDWQSAPFAYIQALPTDAKPVTTWKNRDQAFTSIAEGIRKVVEKLHTVSPVPHSDVPPLSLPLPLTYTPQQPHITSNDRGREDRNRQGVLADVREAARRYLGNSLKGMRPIPLDLPERPDAVENRWNLVYREMSLPAQPLEQKTTILQVYDRAKGELLILGEPGSGKTTLLWQLADSLLTRAFVDKKHNIPVVVQLSTWAEKRLPFVQWLIEELSLLYRIPRRISQTWLEQNQYLLLLDGLDEVSPKHRAACIRAINDYRRTIQAQRKEYAPVLCVVCSRSAEYFVQAERIELSNAVVIQPLMQEQIEDHITQTCGPDSALSGALQRDPVLRELATTPLMLNLLIATHRNAPLQEAGGNVSPQEQRDRILARYVEQVLEERRSAQTPYSSRQVKKWLTCLAQQLTAHNQTVFSMERMQPDWVSDGRRRRLFGPFVGLIIVLTSSAFFIGLNELIGGAIGLLRLFTGVRDFASTWGFSGLIPSVLFGGVVGILAIQIRQEIRPAELVSWSWRDFWQQFVHTGLGVSLLCGLPLILIGSWLFHGQFQAALPHSLAAAIIFGLLYQFAKDIPQFSASQRSKTRHRSWQIQGLLDSLCIALLTLGLMAWNSFFCSIAFTLSLLSLFVTLDPARDRVYPSALSSTHESAQSLRSRLRTGIAFGLAGAIPIYLLVGIPIALIVTFVPPPGQSYRLSEGIFTGHVLGGITAMTFWWLLGIFFGLKSKYQLEGSLFRQTVLIWAGMWKILLRSNVFRNSVIFGLLCSGVIGLVNLFLSGPQQAAISAVSTGWNGVIIGGVATILLNGFSARMREAHTFKQPNLGIWYSLRNGLRIGLLFTALGFGIELLIGRELGISADTLLSAAYIFGMMCGTCGWLLNGGMAYIQHMVLRWLLWRADFTPRTYVQFLDYAAERALLYKVGGSYLFIHHFLQQHFASSLYKQDAEQQTGREMMQ